jgi:UDP-N-acetylmuramoyl-tripeptide--D-alanyl-D-alanine ligase
MMTLAQAHALLPGSVLVGDGTLNFERVHSDTRTLRSGDLFVALRGDRFDAHDFLPAARAAGAVAALAERGLAEAGLSGLQVPDALAALQALSAAWRHRFHLPLIAVTGSNGKTTVTQMIASILRAGHGSGAFATEGNLNNHIGLPLTLLRLRQDDEVWHRTGVVELGMNHPGEIALLSRLAAPTVALVNNAQREHQEFMANVEAVALENGAVLQALPASGVAVFQADDPMTGLWRHLAGDRQVRTFAVVAGPAPSAAAAAADASAQAAWDVSAQAWHIQMRLGSDHLTVQLAQPGLHNVHNALAAAMCAQAAGESLQAIQRGLEAFRPVKGRSQVRALPWAGRTVTLVDDSYNANPDSVLAAIEVLHGLPSPRWLVLGDMGEVGAQGPAFHAEVGARARERGLEHLWCVGALAAASAQAAQAAETGPAAAPSRAAPEVRHFDTVEALLAALQAPAASLPGAASILVKGSRFMRMERVVDALVSRSEAAASSAAPTHRAERAPPTAPEAS